MPFKIIKTLLPVFFLFTFITSCQFNTQFLNLAEDKQAAEAVTNQLYELIKAKDYEATTKLFSDKFFEVTDKEKLFKIFTITNTKLGEMLGSEIEAWETKSTKGTNASTNYVFLYKITYEHFQSKETIRLIKENDGVIRIISYNVDSEGFLN